MLRAWRQRRTEAVPAQAPQPCAAAAAPIAAESRPEAGGESDDKDALLQRWMALAGVQQRVISALVWEIQRTSGVVETEADSLSGRFRTLALGAERQSERVAELGALAVGIEVEGKTVPIVEIAKVLETTLGDVVEKILMLSKDSMAMVYALDDLSANVGRVESCMQQLRKINSTTNFLALNARMEAERAGSAGAAFRVVASEVRELSKATQQLTNSMHAELQSVIAGIASGHDTLKRVATIDMSENILARDRLEVLLSSLVERSEGLNRIVADAAEGVQAMSGDVGAMVTGIQFQDRTRQRLEHVVDTLQVVDRALAQIRDDTAEVVPAAGEASVDSEWLKTLLDGFTMSEMRSRFVEQILEGKVGEEAEAQEVRPADSGTIELF